VRLQHLFDRFFPSFLHLFSLLQLNHFLSQSILRKLLLGRCYSLYVVNPVNQDVFRKLDFLLDTNLVLYRFFFEAQSFLFFLLFNSQLLLDNANHFLLSFIVLCFLDHLSL
jgi:hypothetical protein